MCSGRQSNLHLVPGAALSGASQGGAHGRASRRLPHGTREPEGVGAGGRGGGCPGRGHARGKRSRVPGTPLPPPVRRRSAPGPTSSLWRKNTRRVRKDSGSPQWSEQGKAERGFLQAEARSYTVYSPLRGLPLLTGFLRKRKGTQWTIAMECD
nr:methyl-CpG-binding domain protein 2-like [Saimiri boliviensis boliviensis]